MSLYVVQVPDPPAGFDWSTMVPGQYFWDVTGVTAELSTPSGPSPTVHDSSGNGRDGAYDLFGPPEQFVAGLVGGDLAVLRCDNVAGYEVGFTVPDVGVRWHAPWTATMWFQTPAAGTQDLILLSAQSIVPFSFINWEIRFGFVGYHVTVESPTGFNWQTADGTVPNDGAAHCVTVTFSGAVMVCYIDGVLVPWAAVGIQPALGPALPNVNAPLATGFGNGFRFVSDEYAIWTRALTGPQQAGIFAARGTFAGYTAATLAQVPDEYYHLNDFTAGTGRQPTLVVSDGTHETLAIPSGFPATTLPGPYRYTWQPALNADQQSTDGTITTVAIPQLRIPAGYTVGTRTLDIQPGDQWSNVALWWDDAYMMSLPQFNPYVYPPGANLKFASSGA